MHENRNLYLFLIEINNMHRTRHILRTNIQDLYSGLVQTVRPVRCFVISCYNIFCKLLYYEHWVVQFKSYLIFFTCDWLRSDV